MPLRFQVARGRDDPTRPLSVHPRPEAITTKAGDRSKHAVDQPSGSRAHLLLRPADRLCDRGVIRDPVHEEQLGGPAHECSTYAWFKFRPGALQATRDDRLEGSPS